VEDGLQIQKKAEFVEALQEAHEELAGLRLERKWTPRKVTLDSLPEDQRPNELLPLGKMLCDAVKMIAYRAETAMVALLQRHLKNEAEARALIRDLFVGAGVIPALFAGEDADLDGHERAEAEDLNDEVQMAPRGAIWLL